MEATITAPKAGRVSRLAMNRIQQVEGGDLLAELAWPNSPDEGLGAYPLSGAQSQSG